VTATLSHAHRISMRRSAVVCQEKLWWAFSGSYDGVGDGHCAAIHRVEKMLDENSFPTFYIIHTPQALTAYSLLTAKISIWALLLIVSLYL
jgi:hypothetical protein